MGVKSRSRQDLRLQLLVLYVVFVAGIFAVGFFIYSSASQRLRTDIAAADLNLARAVAQETDDMLLKAKAAVEAFAQMPAVIEADLAGMESAFHAGVAARQDVNLFYRLSDQGIMLYHYPTAPGSTVGQDFSFRDYFKAARAQSEHVFSKGRISPTTGRPVATSVMPVFRQGNFAGVVATNLELQRLTETIERIDLKRPEGGAGNIVIVDAAGQVIAHSESHNLLKNVSEILPGFDNVLSGEEGSRIARDLRGEEWLYSYTPVPSAEWGVIVQRPTRLAFASLDSFQRALVLALFFFGMGALMFWLILSDRVINPLEMLTRYGERVIQEGGEIDADRETVLSIAQRRDQIGRLTDTLLRAEDNIRYRLLELTTLNKTSGAVVSTLDTQQVIDTILDEIQSLLSVYQCALLVVDNSTQQLEVRASRGLSDNYRTTIDLADPTVQDLPPVIAIKSEELVHFPDLDTDRNILPTLSMARTEGYRSGLIIPLKAPHIPSAVLAIYRADANPFNKREIDLATHFANQAAIALEHAMLFSLTDAELQKQVQFLSVLNQVGRSVSQSLVMNDILQNAMDAVFEVMPADACWIYLQREGEDFLRFRAEQGLPELHVEKLRAQRVELGQGAIGWVAQTGQPLILDEINLHRAQRLDDPIIDHGNWQSLVVVPLLAKKTIIGVLGMAAETDRAFAYGEVELLQAIGDQIAIAVVNARLYRQSRELATFEERNRMAREIHDTLAQGFTGILVQLQAAERLSLKNPEQALASLQEARQLAHESLQEARRSVFNLRPSVLENLTLDEAITRQVQRFEVETGVKTDFLLDGYPVSLSTDVEQNLYRITQEALTNVQRHARASNVTVVLSYQSETVTLTIADDGCGFRAPAHNGNGSTLLSKSGHFGVVGILERAELMGGRATFNSPSTGGTQVCVEIPQ